MDGMLPEISTPDDLNDPVSAALISSDIKAATDDILSNLKLPNDEQPKRRRTPKTPVSRGETPYYYEKDLKNVSISANKTLIDLTEQQTMSPSEPIDLTGTDGVPGVLDDLTTPSSGNKNKTPSSDKRQKSSGGKGTYLSMVHDAIVCLKERSGSSVPAIVKCMLSKNEGFSAFPPQMLNRLILAAVKTGVRTGRFVKVKCSYKVNSAWTKKEKLDAQKKGKDKKRNKSLDTNAKIHVDVDATKELKDIDLDLTLTDEERADLRKQKMIAIEATRLKEEAAQRAKDIAERIKKRKFPMDDLELEKEDKELGVKPPSDLGKRPFLPYALTGLVPFDERPRSKKTTPMPVVNACTTNLSSGSFGLISDVLSVYNFFSGDVGFSRIEPTQAPQFALSHLMYAVNEVIIGNCKANKTVPPLLSHLVLSCLNVLTNLSESDLLRTIGSEESNMSKATRRLHHDLSHLAAALTESSWGEILFYYLDLMDRFYSSENSGFPMVDSECLNKIDNDSVLTTPVTNEAVVMYHAYLGDMPGPVYRGFAKLSRMDVWLLSAEELLAIIRCLTDDILSFHPTLADDILKRDEMMAELTRNKKNAESNFRKIRLAYEGPKQSTKSKPKKDSTVDNNSLVESMEDKPTFVPTATKKEYDDAEKARNRAIELYERGQKKYLSRSEPIGYDKHFTKIYWFRNDPDAFFLEAFRSNVINDVTTSWHVIDSKALFDNYTSSLDIRGIRQHNLYEEMMGPSASGSSSMRRYLRDHNHKEVVMLARKREVEDFERRLENAKAKCDAEEIGGRRSGRLAPNAKSELAKLIEEMEVAEKRYEEDIKEKLPNFTILTGIEFLSDYEDQTKSRFRCAHQWLGRNTSIVSMIASQILQLESLCNDLIPWERCDSTRNEWRQKLDRAVDSWNQGLTFHLGPRKQSDTLEGHKTNGDGMDNKESPSRRISGNTAPVSAAYLLQTLKDHLIDIEKRIFTLTGMEKAAREAEEADEIEYLMLNNEGRDSRHTEWKNIIRELYNTPSKRASAIRDIVISAIASARKRHLTNVVEDLRCALQLHRPGAAGQCKSAALKFLEKYGDSDRRIVNDNGQLMEINDDTLEMEENDSISANEPKESIVESFLCAEAMMISGCLEGVENAGRSDWLESVASAKTLSRIGALVTVLSNRANPILCNMKKFQYNFSETLDVWDGAQKSRKARTGKSKQIKDLLQDVWVNARVTNDFILAKIDGYPPWPARICTPKDPAIETLLKNSGLSIITFVGEPHQHIVKCDDNTEPFTMQNVDSVDLSKCDPDLVKKFKQSVTMAKLLVSHQNTPVREGTSK